MALIFGRQSFLGAGEESTWGTAVTRTNFWRLISASLDRKVEKVPRPHLVGDSTAPIYRSHYTKSDKVQGDFEVEAAYEGFGMLLKHWLGSAATTGPSGSDYTHTYTQAASMPTGLSLEFGRGVEDAGASTHAEVFEGCMIKSGTLTGQAGEPLKFKATVIGETSGGRTTQSTPTFPTNDVPVMHYDGGTATFNSASYTMESFELSVDNNLPERQLMGSKNIAQPKGGNWRKAELKITVEYTTDALHTAYLADTQGDVVIALSSGSYSMTITLQNAIITDKSDPISDGGIVKQTITFLAEGSASKHGAKVVMVNQQSSATAA